MEAITPNSSDELLNQVEPEKLREFVRKQAEENSVFRVELNKWLRECMGMKAMSQEQLIAWVRDLFYNVEQKAAWRYHYDDMGIDWSYVGDKMDELLKELQELLRQGKTDIIAEPVLEFFRQVQQNRDDYLYNEESYALDMTHDLCGKLLADWARHPSVTDADKRYVLGELRKFRNFSVYRIHGVYEFNNIYLDYMVAALPPAEAYKMLQKFPMDALNREKVIGLNIDLLRALGRSEEADALLLSNLRSIALVEKELNRLCELGQLREAAVLADRCIQANPEEIEPLEQRLHIAELMHDLPTRIDMHCKLVICSYGVLENFRKLKKIVPPTDWHTVYGNLVVELRRRELTDCMAQIYAEEKDVDSLYELLNSNHYFSPASLIKYIPMLPEKYHHPLLRKGIAILQEEVKHIRKKRDDYRNYAQKLKAFAALPGAAPMVADLAASLRIIYKRYPAMLDELKEL